MTKYRRKAAALLPIAALTCLLLFIAVYTFRFDSTLTEITPFHVRVESGDDAFDIRLWKDENDVYYLFLPGYCRLSDVSFHPDTSARITLDGEVISDGQRLSGLKTGVYYPLTSGRRTYSFCILESSDVPTLYVNTRSGSLKAIHAKKGNYETASVTLLGADGTVDHASIDSCTMRGRGNSTWNYDKRPYLLKFTEATSLLGMNAANRWVLLANAVDETNLRNKIIYDLAAKMDFAWTPRCEYVDLYVNGEYLGLYLLAERVEIGEGRLNIASDPDSFLAKIELDKRLTTLENPIVTNLGRAVEITSPENISSAQTTAIAQKIQLMENAILSGEWNDLLDLDSFVERFLVDEVFMNLDLDHASSYFYYQDGVFYGGPIWDYDHTLGSRLALQNPDVLYNTAAERFTPYANAFYDTPAFRERMLELYETLMLPMLEELRDGGIDAMAQKIEDATTMNSIRWRKMFDTYLWKNQHADDLIVYLTERLNFLRRVWLEGEEICGIHVDMGGTREYMNFSVRPGECLTQLSQIKVAGVSHPIWTDTLTGEVFTDETPVTRNTVLHLSNDPADRWHADTDSKMIKVYLFVLISGVIFFSLIDWRRRAPKRRRSK